MSHINNKDNEFTILYLVYDSVIPYADSPGVSTGEFFRASRSWIISKIPDCSNNTFSIIWLNFS